MEKTCVTFFSKFCYSIERKIPSSVDHISFDTFSCHILDIFDYYDTHFKRKDATYNGMIRLAKIITNFARTG